VHHERIPAVCLWLGTRVRQIEILNGILHQVIYRYRFRPRPRHSTPRFRLVDAPHPAARPSGPASRDRLRTSCASARTDRCTPPLHPQPSLRDRRFAEPKVPVAGNDLPGVFLPLDSIADFKITSCHLFQGSGLGLAPIVFARSFSDPSNISPAARFHLHEW
jgi:hypothetical protein